MRHGQGLWHLRASCTLLLCSVRPLTAVISESEPSPQKSHNALGAVLGHIVGAQKELNTTLLKTYQLSPPTSRTMLLQLLLPHPGNAG